MTDQNAPVTKHLRHAHESMRALKERREAAQALAAFWQAAHAQTAAPPPTPPPLEDAAHG